MTDIADFLEFVEKEGLAQEAEIQSRDLLSVKALVSLGQAIAGLRIVNRNTNSVHLECTENYSRFRPGDRLVFRHELGPAFRGVLHEITHQGQRLHVRAGKLPAIHGEGSWTAVEDGSDLTISVQTALKKLQPGAPGWSFVKRLLGQSSLPDVKAYLPDSDLLSEILTETGLELDQSQIEAFLSCLTLPPILGVQGPPGTGKTLLLALVAEALMRSGKRVVLLAPTHQAVNNALTTLHQLFLDRKVRKFGDELRTESLAQDIPIITSAAKISKEPADSLIGLTFMSALHHLMISDQKMFAPHVVIVDEAGQLPIAQGLCTGLSGAGSILLFGDDKQMPPVFAGDLSEDPLATSTFAQLRSAQPQAIRMMNTTYRLNDDLCGAIGSAFYFENKDDPLHPSDRARDRRFSNSIAEKADEAAIGQALSEQSSLVWLQVPSRNCRQVNKEEAQVAAELVLTCLNAGMSHTEIAVVTPFRRQVMHIRQLVSSQIDEGKPLPIIDTVERVQGLTVEAVIVSFCATETEYVASIAEFLFSPHRLNVAVSRARTKAIVLSNPDILTALPRSFQGVVSKKLCGMFLNSMSRIRLVEGDPPG